MDDCLKCQTSAATPAEPGDLPWWVSNRSNRKLIELIMPALPAIIAAIERDEAVIEFIGR
jgi:hypothetical protein